MDDARELLSAGFSHEQVARICESSEAPAGRPPPGDSEPESAGPLSLGLIEAEPGFDGTWNKYVLGDIFVIENKVDPGAYFALLSPEPLPSDWRSVTSEIRYSHQLADSDVSGPALAFSTDPKAEELTCFNFRQDGTINVYKLRGDNLTLVTSKQVPEAAFDDYKFRTYALVRDGTKVKLTIDGTETGVESTYDDTKPTVAGVNIIGIGSYELRSLRAEAR